MYNLAEHGFVVIKNVFDPDFLAERRAYVRQIIDYASKQNVDPFEKYYLPHRTDQGALYDLCQRYMGFMEMAKSPEVIERLKQVLGENIFLYENSLVYKPGGKSNGVPFHQDFISRPDEPIKFIAWMPIDRVTKQNGALKVIPGSHKNGFLPWYRVKGETHHDRIKEGAFDPSQAIHVELEAGDVLIFNQLLVHGSDEIKEGGGDLRLVYRVSYQNFDEVYVPRGAPIVLNGAHPQELSRLWTKPKVTQPKKPLYKKVFHKMGSMLMKI